jgi:hypothetical protein
MWYRHLSSLNGHVIRLVLLRHKLASEGRRLCSMKVSAAAEVE